ncbi:small nuclear ribonucleoprotein E-like [Sturnira hondurensis]|uniref:small nuclear ribonucleoprotein E-like n=1 Tax=Sturnira hondurensis TaxID=192404 RepID=UPI001879FD6F|nr:small nuclear ribonucleoprotein E-like [Sturnira hondurensis]
MGGEETSTTGRSKSKVKQQKHSGVGDGMLFPREEPATECTVPAKLQLIFLIPSKNPGLWLRQIWGLLSTPTRADHGQSQKVLKVMGQPINLIFRYLQNRCQIQVWLYEQVNMQIEGCVTGFDEYVNLVLDDADEIHSKTKSRKQLGRITIKGDNITLFQSVSN